MRDIFPSYYPPSRNQFSTLWNESLFVLDANVLLDLYRYSPPSKDELINILTSKLAERLWIPHQVALEYMKNRPDVILTQVSVYEKAGSIIPELLNEERENSIRKDLNVRHHPFVSAESLLLQIREALSKIVDDLDQEMKKHPDLITDDPILDIVTSLLHGKVGKPYSPDRLEEIYKEGEERYTSKLPPGYSDAEGSKKKEGNTKYGDLVLWYQTIDKAGETKKSIILVTNETTEDWWWICKGRTIGPRPELIDEMMSKSHVSFYMYNSDRFMTFAREYLETPVKQEAIDEVRDIRMRDEETRHRAIDFGVYPPSFGQYIGRNILEALQLPENLMRFTEGMDKQIERYRYIQESLAYLPYDLLHPQQSVQHPTETKEPDQEELGKLDNNEADSASEQGSTDNSESD